MRHKPGARNAIWSDLYIETTFMRYGHGPNGIVGITLQPSALKRWALSMHTCSRLVRDVADMDKGYTEKGVMIYKEERPAQIKSDAKDRRNILHKLQSCIDPMDPTNHPDELVIIVTGRVAPGTVNAGLSAQIGTGQLRKFEESLPDGFNRTISKNVVTMSFNRKALKVGSTRVVDANLIYNRVFGLYQSRGIQLDKVLHH